MHRLSLLRFFVLFISVFVCTGYNVGTSAINFDCSISGSGDHADPQQPCASNYVTCSNGKPYARACPEKLFFDQGTDSCLPYSQVAACNGGQINPSNTFPNQPQAPPISLPPGWTCPQQSGNFKAPGALRCSVYYVKCQSNVPSFESCNSGLIFNKKIQSCDYPNNVAGCDETFCQGKIDGRYWFPGLPLDRCTSRYVQCKQQITTYARCPTPLAFEITTGACVMRSELSQCANVQQQPASVEAQASQQAAPPLVFPQNAPATGYQRQQLGSEMCQGKPDGQYALPGGGCDGAYLSCVAGSPTIHNCPADLVFSAQTISCQYRYEVDVCQTGQAPMAPRWQPQGIYNQPQAPPASYVAAAPQAPPASYVAAAPQAPPAINDVVCAGRSDGNVQLPGGTGCDDSFVQCSSGNAYASQCPDPLVYNPTIDRCDWKANVDACRGQFQSPTLPQAAPSSAVSYNAPSQPASPPAISQGLCNGKSNGVQSLPNALTCQATNYLSCSNGQQLTMPCPLGSVFNPTTSRCDWISQVPGCSGSSSTNQIQTIPVPEAPPIINQPSTNVIVDNGYCLTKPNGLYPIPFSTGCDSQFVSCSNNLMYVFDCPMYTVYSPQTLRCEWRHEICQGVLILSPAPTPTLPPSSPPFQFPSQIPNQNYIVPPPPLPAAAPPPQQFWNYGVTDYKNRKRPTEVFYPPLSEPAYQVPVPNAAGIPESDPFVESFGDALDFEPTLIGIIRPSSREEDRSISRERDDDDENDKKNRKDDDEFFCGEGREDGSYPVPAGRVCTPLYYKCKRGRVQFWRCRSHQVFHNLKRKCVNRDDDDSRCAYSMEAYSTFFCQGKIENRNHSYPLKDCTEFYYDCQQSKLNVHQCPEGRLFSRKLERCTSRCRAKHFTDDPDSWFCYQRSNNGFSFPQPSCNVRYFKCYKGQVSFHTCKYNHVWNGIDCVPKYICPDYDNRTHDIAWDDHLDAAVRRLLELKTCKNANDFDFVVPEEPCSKVFGVCVNGNIKPQFCGGFSTIVADENTISCNTVSQCLPQPDFLDNRDFPVEDDYCQQHGAGFTAERRCGQKYALCYCTGKANETCNPELIRLSCLDKSLVFDSSLSKCISQRKSHKCRPRRHRGKKRRHHPRKYCDGRSPGRFPTGYCSNVFIDCFEFKYNRCGPGLVFYHGSCIRRNCWPDENLYGGNDEQVADLQGTYPEEPYDSKYSEEGYNSDEDTEVNIRNYKGKK